MKLSDFNPTQNTSSLVAGENLIPKDLIEIYGNDGKGYKVDVSSFAAVGNVDYGTAQTSTATGRIVTQTSIVVSQTAANARQALVMNSSANIFTLTDYSSGAGLKISKYSAAGELLAYVDIAATVVRNNHHILLLSNGNLACLAKKGGGGDLEYAVYDTNLNLVKTLTSVAAANQIYFSACALSGGGFAVLYQNNATPLASDLKTYDNTGTETLAATTIWTRTGTTGVQYHKIDQLSSGNIVVAVSSVNTVSSIGLYYGVVSTAGAIVKAFTSLDTTSMAWYPELAVMTGYFAVAMPNGTNQKAYVFDNSGTQQGSSLSEATTSGGVSNKTKLLSDGTVFWLIWHRNTDSKCCTSKLPVTGTGYTTIVTTTSTTQYNHYLDAFYEAGLIVGTSMSGGGNTAPVFWVISTTTGGLINPAGTTFGTAPGTTNGLYPRIIAGGDRSFISLYDYATTEATNLCIGKYAKTAVIGVAQITAAGGATVRMYTQAGAYEINSVIGTASGFDHTANSLVGNKGAILPQGVTLRGIGA